MSRVILIAMVLAVTAGTVSADLAEGPIRTILWNQMDLVAVVDSRAVGFSSEAVIVSRWSLSLKQFVVEAVHEIDYEPAAVRTAGSLVMVHTADHRVIAYEANRLPELVAAWVADPGVAFSDWALVGNRLYLSRWFEGIWRYEIGGLEGARLLDTSMVGVLVTQMEADDSYVYVLDEYNGIMRYDPSQAGSSAFVDYLYVRQEIFAFAQVDSTAAMIARSGGVVIGRYAGEQSLVQPVVAEEARPQRVYLSGDEMVTVAPRSIEVRDRATGEVRSQISPPGVVTDGVLWSADGVRYLVLPRMEGGLYLFNIDEPIKSGPGLYRSGPIKTLAFSEGRLLTAGGYNPIEAYSFDSALTPQLEFTVFPKLTGVEEITPVGDTLLAYIAGANRIAVFIERAEPDSFYVDRILGVEDTLVHDLLFLPRLRYDSLRAIVAVGRESVQSFAIDENGSVEALPPWNQQFGLISACVTDTMLFMGSGKGQIWTYRINSGLAAELASITDLSSRPEVMEWISGRLLIFLRNQYQIFSLGENGALHLEHEGAAPTAVADVVLAGERLYTIGSTGIGVFSLTGEWPELIESGGEPGSMIAVEGNVAAGSDGGSVKIYRLGPAPDPDPEPDPDPDPEPEPQLPKDFTLNQNFPNPFNAGTVIRYAVPQGVHVRLTVFNVLGQRVRTLVDGYRAAGEYEAVWDGTDHTGSAAASGLYVYRLEAEKAVMTRKMVLMK